MPEQQLFPQGARRSFKTGCVIYSSPGHEYSTGYFITVYCTFSQWPISLNNSNVPE